MNYSDKFDQFGNLRESPFTWIDGALCAAAVAVIALLTSGWLA